MAAYAATVVKIPNVAEKIGLGMTVLFGTIDVTNYNQTVAEITDITNFFRGTPVVMVDGISDNGYLTNWDVTDEGVKAWYPTNASDQTPTVDIAAAAAVEVANDVDVGKVSFLAIGIA